MAGNGTYGFGSDDVQATNTSLYYPYSVAVLHTTGELVISDTDNHRIRKVDSSGFISTIVGNGRKTDDAGVGLGDSGPATRATLNRPKGIVVNSNGVLFIADSGNYRIRRIGTDGKITTIAGTGEKGTAEDSGAATSVNIGVITGLAINRVDDLFMVDQLNHCVRQLANDSQIITTFAGVCGLNNGGYSGENVLATTAELYSPSGVAFKINGEVVIADTENHRIRRVSTDGFIKTVAGNGIGGFSGESGVAIDAKLSNPTSIAVTNIGEIVVSDSEHQKIRKVDKHGIITAVAGNGMLGYGGDGGSAINSLINNAGGVAVTDTGDVLFADTGNNRIRKVDSNGTIVTIAGNGTADFTGDWVLATETALNQPQSVAYLNGEVYIADTNNNRVRKILANGTIITIAGNGIGDHCGDDDFAIEACVNHPVSVVVNRVGEVFISDESYSFVRKVDISGIISRIAGTPMWMGGYSGDGGLAVDAWLNSPRGLAFNNEGELLIADAGNNRIRKVNNSRIITTIVAELSNPVALGVGKMGFY